MTLNGKPCILVTGGSGLVGHGIKYAANELSNFEDYEWVYLSSKDCDLTDAQETMSVFQQLKPMYIIHLAARVGGLYAHLKDNKGFLFENLKINMNVCEAAYASGCMNMACCLSTCILPDNATLPLTEDVLFDGPPHNSNFGYSYAKRMLAVMCRCFNEQFKTNYIPIIPTNIYGPHDNFKLDVAHVIPSLIHKAYLNRGTKEPLLVCGTGTATRQFIYSKDLGRIILKILFSHKQPEPVIVSVPEEEEMTVAEAAQVIADTFHLDGGIKISGVESDGQKKKTVSINKLKKLCPDFEFTPFEQGIAETCEWLAKNYKDARV